MLTVHVPLNFAYKALDHSLIEGGREEQLLVLNQVNWPASG